MAVKKGNAQAVYNSGGITLSDGDETGLFVNSTGALITSTTISANSSVNVAQLAGTTTSVNNGAVDAGTLRVTVANDSTGQIKLATGTNAVGSVNVTSATTGGASFLNIAAGQATTTVKSGAGTLYAICLNSAATATNTTTVYDNTAASGTVIAIPAVTTATVPTTLTFGPAGLAFATGLTVITATANGGNMTFIYK